MKLLRDLTGVLIGLIEALLIFRLILKLANADAQSELVAWIYEYSQPFLQPFMMAFPTPSVRGGFQLEFTTIFAIFGYAFLGYILQELFDFLHKRQTKHKETDKNTTHDHEEA